MQNMSSNKFCSYKQTYVARTSKSLIKKNKQHILESF